MRPRPARQAVQSLDTVATSLRRAKRRLSSWRAVAREFGISTATAIRVANGYEPKRADIRRALGLCEYAPAPVCHKCGRVHELLKKCGPRKTSTNAKPRRDWKRLSLWLSGIIAYSNAKAERAREEWSAVE